MGDEIDEGEGDDGISMVVDIVAILAMAAENSTMEKGLIKMTSAPAAKNIFTSDSRAFPVTVTIGRVLCYEVEV